MSTFREQIDAQLVQLNRQLAPLRARYDALQPREQLVVAAGGAVGALVLVYLLLWQPFVLFRDHGEHQLQTERAMAARIEQLGAMAQQSHPTGAGPAVGQNVSLLSAVDQATNDGTLSKKPSRMQPDGDNQVRVWIEDESFDKVLRWMNTLQTRYGIRIDNVAIERRPTAGSVNARLSLVRGS